MTVPSDSASRASTTANVHSFVSSEYLVPIGLVRDSTPGS